MKLLSEALNIVYGGMFICAVFLMSLLIAKGFAITHAKTGLIGTLIFGVILFYLSGKTIRKMAEKKKYIHIKHVRGMK